MLVASSLRDREWKEKTLRSSCTAEDKFGALFAEGVE